MPQRRVVVITGASAGVGRAAAHAFARCGADMGLIARNAEALEAVRAEVEGMGGQAVACVADAALHDQLEAAASAIEQALGPIDVWVNNAMLTVVSPVAALQPEEVQRVTEVTYLGAVNGTLCALRRMRLRNRGTIVQVGSALSRRAIPLQAAYCGAKFALRGFTEALRCELLHERSRVAVTMVQLPAVNTPQFDWCRTRMPGRPRPVSPIFQPEVAARAILWAARHPRRELLVGGSTVMAMVAGTLAPGLVDRYLARRGYSGQQSAEPTEPDRIDNLWQPPPEDRYATHGRFDAQSRSHSAQLWMTTHRGWLLGALLAGFLAWLARRHSRRNGWRTPWKA